MTMEALEFPDDQQFDDRLLVHAAHAHSLEEQRPFRWRNEISIQAGIEPGLHLFQSCPPESTAETQTPSADWGMRRIFL